ncbi:MAG: hypothetical protein KDK78_01975 [Chlamydiia bacterium]|nr:hypothetical protein [Chlamydiia bacterium]
MTGPVDTNSFNSLVEHCRFFAHHDGPQEGKITYDSLKTSLESLGISSGRSKVMSAALMVLLSGKCGHLIPASELDPARVAECAMHSCSTRIFSREEGKVGEFNEEEWQRFKTQIEADCVSLTAEELGQIREANAQRSTDEGEACCLRLRMDANFSAGEFDLLFEVGADTVKDGEPAISMERMERLYRLGAAVFEEIAASRQAS